MCHGPRAAAKRRSECNLHTPAPTAIVYCVPSEFALSRAESSCGEACLSARALLESRCCGLTAWQESSLNTLSCYFLILSEYGHFFFKTNIKHLSVSDFLFQPCVCSALHSRRGAAWKLGRESASGRLGTARCLEHQKARSCSWVYPRCTKGSFWSAHKTLEPNPGALGGSTGLPHLAEEIVDGTELLGQR